MEGELNGVQGCGIETLTWTLWAQTTAVLAALKIIMAEVTPEPRGSGHVTCCVTFEAVTLKP